MSASLVSVLMTSYNRQAFIAEAIESVLASTYKNFELVICDDNSSDGTADIARLYQSKDKRVRLFTHSDNIGDYPNRNRAASYALGDFIIYSDSDDILYPHAIEVFLACFSKYPEASLAFEDIHDVDGYFPRMLSPVQSYRRHFFGRRLFSRAPGSVMIRSEVFKNLNGFSGKRYIGDFEFWLRSCAICNIVLVPGMLHWVRRHPGQEMNLDILLYRRLILETTYEYLTAGNCPLEAGERRKALALIKKRFNRLLMRRFLNGKVSPGQFFRFMKDTGAMRMPAVTSS